MRKLLNEEELSLIKESVEKAEKKTVGEIVPMIVFESDRYPATYFRASLFISLCATCLYYYFFDISDKFENIIFVQFAGVFIGYLLAFIPSIRRFLVSAAERNEEVHQRALQGFIENNLHSTTNRSGVLIMVSLLERRVEILADIGINGKVTPDFWKDMVNKLVLNVKTGHLANGLCQCIDECGELLGRHFPASDDQNLTNELKDDLIIKDS
jgi:putative membrane protein